MLPKTAPHPNNAIVILLDSLNRHMLGAYGGREFATPNLDAFARRAVRFNRHYAGSLPCMPARHDILCGALDFLWKPWGSVEIWEDADHRTAARRRRRHQLITRSSASVRDRRRELPRRLHRLGLSARPRGRRLEDAARSRRGSARRRSAAGTCPTTTRAAGSAARRTFPARGPCAPARAGWSGNAGADERFFSVVDEFDPHEPFDTPEPYAAMYDPSGPGRI